MEIILLEKIRNLGNLGDQVNVAAGYGRNFLIPKGKALPATKKNVADFEKGRAEFERISQQDLAQAQARHEKLAALTIVLPARAADNKLYGSIGPREIADAVTRLGVPLAKHEVRLPVGHIRVTGEYTVQVQLHSEVSGNVMIKIVSEASRES